MNCLRQLILLLILAVAGFSSCARDTGDEKSLSGAVPSLSPAAITDLGSGIYLNGAGWKVPLSVPMDLIDHGFSEFNDSKGRNVQSSYTSFRFKSPFITDEFKEVWGRDGSTVQASTITRVEVKGVIYKYELLGMFGKTDRESGKFVILGPATLFSYVDRDADGVFETLDAGSMGTAFSSWIDDLN